MTVKSRIGSSRFHFRLYSYTRFVVVVVVFIAVAETHPLIG